MERRGKNKVLSFLKAASQKDRKGKKLRNSPTKGRHFRRRGMKAKICKAWKSIIKVLERTNKENTRWRDK